MKKQYPYIIFFTHTNKLSGGERSMLEIIKGIKKEIKISVILPGEGQLKDEIKKEGINVFSINEYSFFKIKRDKILNIIFYLRELICAIRELKGIISKEKPDILWTNSQKAHILSIFLKIFFNLRLVWHFRDILEGKNRFLVNLFSVFPDKIIAISNEVKKQFFIKRKISIVYNGLSIPDNLTKKIKGGKTKIGYIGQIAEWKGQMNFLKVMKEVKNAKGYIIGDVLFGEEEYLKMLKEYIKDNKLEEKVSFLGFKKDNLNYISSMDIIVHLPVKPEPFGRVLMEAMGLGVPIVTHDIGAIREVLKGTGIIVNFGEIEKVVEWIGILSNDKKKRLKIGYEEKNAFLKNYRAELYIENIKKIIKEILRLKI